MIVVMNAVVEERRRRLYAFNEFSVNGGNY